MHVKSIIWFQFKKNEKMARWRYYTKTKKNESLEVPGVPKYTDIIPKCYFDDLDNMLAQIE